ncbi:MAG TPA: hypothetical protein VHJ54_11300 [Solirubrobacterales bacterium]|nr:hypothetical protein [Solirubrobacterales bacterium]
MARGPEQPAELGQRYGLEADPGSIPRLCAEHEPDDPMLHT